MRIAGTAALVTGAASGLGAATAAALAAQGATVYGLDLPSAIERAAAADRRRTASPWSPPTSPRAAGRGRVRQVHRRGAVPLRVVVSCAGVAPGRAHAVARPGRTTSSCSARVVDGQPARHVQRDAAGRRGDRGDRAVDEQGQRGVVVNTASVAAFDGQIGQIAYAASKGGVRGHDPAGRPRPGAVRHPRHHDRARHRRHPDAGRRHRRVPRRASQPACRSRRGSAAPTSTRSWSLMIVEHDYLNGETIRMDGALRMAPR